MTTPTATPEQSYSPSGSSTGPFATVFGYESSSQVGVSTIDADEVKTALTLGVDFTVAATGGDSLANGGDVTLVSDAVPSGGWAGGRVAIERLTPAEQDLDLPNDEGLQPEDIEDALDKLMRIVQELRAGLLRSLKVNIGETSIPTVAELIQTIINQIVALLEGSEVEQTVIDAVLNNLATIIAAAAAELQAIIDAMAAAALALVPIVYATDGGAANAIELTLDPPSVEADLAEGFTVIVKVAADTTGATTIEVDGFGPFDVKYCTGEALQAGALQAAGTYLLAMTAASTFQVVGMSPAPEDPVIVEPDIGFDYTFGDPTIIYHPPQGSFRLVEIHKVVAVATDAVETESFGVTFAEAPHVHVTSRSQAAPGSGTRMNAWSAKPLSTSTFEIRNDANACDFDCHIVGKVAV